MKKYISVMLLISMIIGAGTMDIEVWGKANTNPSTPNGPIRSYTKTISVNKVAKTVNVVEVDLKNEAISLEVAISHDKIGGAENFGGWVKRKKAAAAINANFFNAYTDLEPLGIIAMKGEIIHLGNSGTTVGIKENKELVFGSMNTVVKGALDGKYKNEYIDDAMVWNTWNAWNINNLDTKEDSVAVYTPLRGKTINLKAGMAVTVNQGEVMKVQETPGEIPIPEAGYVIYFGPKIDKDAKAFVNNRFKPGRKVEFQYRTKQEIEQESTEFVWTDLQQAITAGPRLLTDGVIKVDAKAEGFKEAKIITSRAQRSALGVTKEGKMLMVTVANVNIQELANIMKGLGAHNALNLDGGASSGLFCKGKMITTPGRNLSTVLLVHEKQK